MGSETYGSSIDKDWNHRNSSSWCLAWAHCSKRGLKKCGRNCKYKCHKSCFDEAVFCWSLMYHKYYPFGINLRVRLAKRWKRGHRFIGRLSCFSSCWVKGTSEPLILSQNATQRCFQSCIAKNCTIHRISHNTYS